MNRPGLGSGYGGENPAEIMPRNMPGLVEWHTSVFAWNDQCECIVAFGFDSPPELFAYAAMRPLFLFMAAVL